MRPPGSVSALLLMTAYAADEAEKLGLRFVKYCLDMAHSELKVVSRQADLDAVSGPPPARGRGRPRRQGAALAAPAPLAANDGHVPARPAAAE